MHMALSESSRNYEIIREIKLQKLLMLYRGYKMRK